MIIIGVDTDAGSLDSNIGPTMRAQLDELIIDNDVS